MHTVPVFDAYIPWHLAPGLKKKTFIFDSTSNLRAKNERIFHWTKKKKKKNLEAAVFVSFFFQSSSTLCIFEMCLFERSEWQSITFYF